MLSFRPHYGMTSTNTRNCSILFLRPETVTMRGAAQRTIARRAAAQTRAPRFATVRVRLTLARLVQHVIKI
eukprot:6196290-Pleurochrysis_carterae.AAC.2